MVQTGSSQTPAKGFNLLHPINMVFKNNTIKIKKNAESAAEILVFSAEKEAVLLLRCSIKVKVQETSLEQSMGSVCFHRTLICLLNLDTNLAVGTTTALKFSPGQIA